MLIQRKSQRFRRSTTRRFRVAPGAPRHCARLHERDESRMVRLKRGETGQSTSDLTKRQCPTTEI
jgi:hypothetical protein